MTPPLTYDTVDAHGGITVLTRSGDSLWVPAKGETLGVLHSYDERSFYQNHKDVTKALYRVKGERRLVMVWFCNRTGVRVDGRSFVAPLAGPCDCV